MFHPVAALAAFFLLHSHQAFAAETIAPIEVAPIIKEGTPGDALMQDPVAPSWRGEANPGSGTGTLHKSLSDRLAVPIIGTSVPGNNVQFRGLGRSAEDTDVQALGIPLNPAQGGGFDLSIFPQFIWAGYEYQVGPALGTFDPRGTSGSLTLVPWTAQALGAGSAGEARAAALGSSSNLFQVSAAASDGKSVAAVAGASSGDAQGPSMAFSARWRVSESETASFHLLLTDIEARTPGPGGYTPFARQQTVRGIPLLQLDSKLGAQGLLKSSAFFDGEYLKYTDPSASALPATQDHILQAGTENALLWGDWKFGAGIRGVRYQTIGFDDQSEAVVNLLASRGIDLGRGWLIEPAIRAVGVTRYGMLPEASLGVRVEPVEGLGLFARGGLSRHFPSMVNRFYSYPGFPGYPGFIGNPALQPERDWSGTAGVEWNGKLVQAGLQGYAQIAQDAQVRAPLDAQNDTETNSGQARIASILGRVQVLPVAWLTAGGSFSLSASQLEQTGLSFPGLPAALAVLSVGVHWAGWGAWAYERVSGTAVADAKGNLLPSYHEEDLEFRARFEKSWLALARAEDLSDQRPELVRGYPSLGRSFSVLVSREW